MIDRTPQPAPTASPHTAVTGLQWGDEGKGKIVDLLTEQFDVVVRYNGGNNAGHTVWVGDERYALHLLPSGILYGDKLNVIGNGVVVDPAGLLGEIDGLAERGVPIRDNLRISERAHLVMPYHKQADALLEAAVSRGRGEAKKIGTTGRGIGPTYADKMLRTLALRMADLANPDRFADKLRHIVKVRNATLGALADVADQPFQPWDADRMAQAYLEYGRRLRPFICDTNELLHRRMAEGKQLLFEGANACLLDVDHGTYPYVTSSNCASVGIYPGAGVPGGTVGRVVGVAKLYTSRVGAGPFPTEQDNDTGQAIRDGGNEYGTTTGRPRRCGWIDLFALKYAMRLSGVTELACTGLSVLAGLDELKLCTGYRYRGQALGGYPADSQVLDQVEPVYQTLDGFADETDQATRFDDLPAAARQYIRCIEDYLQVPATMICVGRKRSQILHHHRDEPIPCQPA
ncbi:MAG: adenylosuccinate synthase [Alphaproteobacteria bacterium]|jgi:adenylosuccinate synthase|nr:adenylosuccinate synthase [Alphaproteobacteria bacterium]